MSKSPELKVREALLCRQSHSYQVQAYPDSRHACSTHCCAVWVQPCCTNRLSAVRMRWQVLCMLLKAAAMPTLCVQTRSWLVLVPRAARPPAVLKQTSCEHCVLGLGVAAAQQSRSSWLSRWSLVRQHQAKLLQVSCKYLALSNLTCAGRDAACPGSLPPLGIPAAQQGRVQGGRAASGGVRALSGPVHPSAATLPEAWGYRAACGG